MAIELAPYQLEAVERLLRNPRHGLFDEQGVGKTFPAIMAGRSMVPTGTKLLTVPAYIIPDWEKAIHQMFPGDSVVAASGDIPSRRQAALESTADWVLISYNMWANNHPLTPLEKQFEKEGGKVVRRSRYPILYKRPWPLLIFDEAHRLRGRNSLWTEQVIKLRNMDRKTRDSVYWFLTGTPQVRDAGDLYPFLKMMDRDRFRGYWPFVEEWCNITETPWDKVVGGVKLGMEPAFKALMDKYSLRRLVSEVPELATLEKLPAEFLTVRMPASVYATMQKMKKEWVIEHPDLDSSKAIESGGAMIHELRQMTALPPTQANPKLETLCDFLEDNATEPVIVWCWYRETAKRYAEAIKKRHRQVNVFSGDTPLREKTRMLEWFVSERDNPNGVLVATIAAMKEGVNLQRCNLNVFVEQSELPSDDDQAIARTLRRGQTRPVRVVIIHGDKTIDQIVWRHQDKRRTNITRSMLEEIREEFR